VSFQLSLSTESVSTAYPDPPLFVTPGSTVGEVIGLLRAQQTGSVLVCDDENNSRDNPQSGGSHAPEGDASSSKEDEETGNGKLLGIFTERDALRCMAAASSGGDQGKVMQQPVSAVMSTEITSLQADASTGEAIKTMSQGGYRHLPILADDGKPTSMETVYGIVRYLVDHFPQTIYNLPPNPRPMTSEREGA